MRLLLGVLAGQEFQAKLTGDESLQARPRISWQTLGGDDHDVDDFMDRCEETASFANDCKGTSSPERLKVLGNCLKHRGDSK